MNTGSEHRTMSRIVRRKPITLGPDASVQQACTLMHTHRIGAIMIVDEKQHLLGIFTGRDAVRLLAEGRNPAHTHLRQVMTADPAHIPPTHGAIHALRLMQDGGFRHVPVVDAGKVVGLVSHGDFQHHEWDRLNEETGYWERL